MRRHHYSGRLATATLAVGGGQTEAAMPDEDELVNAKRRRLTEARRRERLEELDAEQRLARQRRKEKALKRRIAEKQHAADAGADVEDFSSDDSDDSLLTEEDLMHIEKCVVEDEDNEVEVQFLAADPQKWVLACTLTGHKAAVTCVALSLGSQLGFGEWMSTTAIANTISGLPISPGGLGVGEHLFGALAALFGSTYAMGVATSLLFRVGLYTLSLAGGVVMLFPEAERAG